MKIVRFLIVLYLFPIFGSQSQQLIYENYSTHNGMPSSEVYCFYQDKNGVMWFATDRGLANYDGNKFRSFDKNDGIPSSTVFKFFPQKDGKVWCSTVENKWFWFEDGQQEFNVYEHNDSLIKYAKGAHYFDFIEDDNGVKHFSFWAREGVVSITPNGDVVSTLMDIPDVHKDRTLVQEIDNKNRSFTYLWTKDNPSRMIYASNRNEVGLTEIGYGFIKFAFVESVSVFSIGTKVVLSKDGDSKIIEFNTRIISSGKFDDGLIWLGTVGSGLLIIDHNGTIQAHYLDGKQVSYCYRDAYDGIWIATLSDGVYYCRSQLFLLYGTKKDNVSSMNIGKNGPLVTMQDENLIELTENGKVSVKLNADVEGPSNGVYNELFDANIIFEKAQNGIRVKGTNQDTFFLMTGVTFSGMTHKPLLAAGRGNILILDPNKFKAIPFEENRVNTVEWAEKGVYVGTMDGLYFYDTLTDQSRKIIDKRLDVRVESIKCKSKKYFIATRGNGIARMVNEKFQFVDESNGLSSNLVNDVFPVSDSVVWVATNKGLNYVKFGKNGLKIRLLDKSNGLPDNDVTKVVEQNGKIWIGTRSGLCSIDQDNWRDLNWSTINLYLRFKKVWLEGKEFKMSNGAIFNSEQNTFDFDLGVVSFAANNSIIIRYRLKDTDDWKYCPQRRLSLIDLRPGSYHLVVQASIKGKIWNQNQIEYSFTISPPFYRTWWFLTLIFLFFAFLVHLFFRFRVLIYNKDLVRKILLHITRKLTSSTHTFIIREQGRDCKIKSSEVLFVQSNGNYLNIQTTNRRYVIRMKIGEFLAIVPDKLEFLRVNRSYIIRLDKVTEYSTKSLWVGGNEVPIGFTYQKEVSLLLK